MDSLVKKNVVQKDWGYEILWASKDNYGGKILIFNRKNAKTPFTLQSSSEKTWFINTGVFFIRWINTSNGKMLQQELKEGDVFDIGKLVPVSVECLSDNGSITEANSGIKDDTHIILPAGNVK